MSCRDLGITLDQLFNKGLTVCPTDGEDRFRNVAVNNNDPVENA